MLACLNGKRIPRLLVWLNGDDGRGIFKQRRAGDHLSPRSASAKMSICGYPCRHFRPVSMKSQPVGLQAPSISRERLQTLLSRPLGVASVSTSMAAGRPYNRWNPDSSRCCNTRYSIRMLRVPQRRPPPRRPPHDRRLRGPRRELQDGRGLDDIHSRVPQLRILDRQRQPRLPGNGRRLREILRPGSRHHRPVVRMHHLV